LARGNYGASSAHFAREYFLEFLEFGLKGLPTLPQRDMVQVARILRGNIFGGYTGFPAIMRYQ